jgi:hypothetical protein
VDLTKNKYLVPNIITLNLDAWICCPKKKKKRKEKIWIDAICLMFIIHQYSEDPPVFWVLIYLAKCDLLAGTHSLNLRNWAIQEMVNSWDLATETPDHIYSSLLFSFFFFFNLKNYLIAKNWD